VTPGFDLILRDDVIITSSETFPSPDTTHACLLRSTPHGVDNLITEITTYFKSKNLPTTLFVSPACTPADLPERLLRQGFVRQEAEEAWLTFDNLLNFEVPPPVPGVAVKQMNEGEVMTFARIFMIAFELPLDGAPYMAQLMAPSVGLPGVYYYLAVLDEEPIGICSLICHRQVGILGSAGVMPAQRGSQASRNLVLQAACQAQQHGVETLVLQTTAGTSLERFLRLQGFKRAFTRISFSLA
jgi:hypothetical protein